MTHFLKTRRARTLPLAKVLTMSDEEAFLELLKHRWPETDGQPICPRCGDDHIYRYKSRRVYKCAACAKHFTVTSGTLFHSAKLPYQKYLAILAMFSNASKGISALAVSIAVDISYKSAFVLLHKLRSGLQETRGDLRLSGEVEVDGAYFGGYIRPPNRGREGKRPLFKREKQCLLTIVERGGSSVPVLVPGETTIAVLAAARKHILPDSTVYTDEANCYDALNAWYDTRRINHRWAYAVGPISTNWAETIHARQRRSERGIHHHVSGPHLLAYAFENCYRHDRRRTDKRAIFDELLGMSLSLPVSRKWKGAWQARAPLDPDGHLRL